MRPGTSFFLTFLFYLGAGGERTSPSSTLPGFRFFFERNGTLGWPFHGAPLTQWGTQLCRPLLRVPSGFCMVTFLHYFLQRSSPIPFPFAPTVFSCLDAVVWPVLVFPFSFFPKGLLCFRHSEKEYPPPLTALSPGPGFAYIQGWFFIPFRPPNELVWRFVYFLGFALIRAADKPLDLWVVCPSNCEPPRFAFSCLPAPLHYPYFFPAFQPSPFSRHFFTKRLLLGTPSSSS